MCSNSSIRNSSGFAGSVHIWRTLRHSNSSHEQPALDIELSHLPQRTMSTPYPPPPSPVLRTTPLFRPEYAYDKTPPPFSTTTAMRARLGHRNTRPPVSSTRRTGSNSTRTASIVRRSTNWHESARSYATKWFSRRSRPAVSSQTTNTRRTARPSRHAS